MSNLASVGGLFEANLDGIKVAMAIISRFNSGKDGIIVIVMMMLMMTISRESNFLVWCCHSVL